MRSRNETQAFATIGEIPDLIFADAALSKGLHVAFKMDSLEKKLETLEVKQEELAEAKEREPPRIKMTGLIYDSRMLKHCNELDPNHPEVPERISLVWAMLDRRGITDRCLVLQSREATKDEIELAHDSSYFEDIAKTADFSKEELYQAILSYNSGVYMNNSTFLSAKLAAGCVIEMTKQVVQGKIKNGFAFVRPPGHHAECGFSMGFCHFNNVAIAAKYAIEKLGLSRVLIVDWDVHHGNGTQNMFYNDKRVLYFSLHRYDNASYYPENPDANYSYAGGASALGYNINVAWNWDTMGDAEYLLAFHHILMPIGYEFKPELVLVSCGFDAAEGDPLGRYEVTPTGYAHMTHLLTGLANGKVVVALEGGYNLSAIQESTAAIATVLLGDQPLPQFKKPLVPCESAIRSVVCTGLTHSQYWESMKMFAEISKAVNQLCADETTTKPLDVQEEESIATCINRTPKRQYKCPYCQEVGGYHEMTTTHMTECAHVILDCQNEDCNESLPRNQLPSHEAVCPFENLNCENCHLGCQKRFYRKDMKNHVQSHCLKRQYACPRCSEVGVYDQITTVHLKTCTQIEVDCRNKY